MALPSITTRPTKTSGAFVSKWSAAHNPIVYKFANDKWPENTNDAAENITDHEDDYGNAKFTIAGHPYQVLEWVIIYDSDVASYNGIWQIIAEDTNSITLDLPYEAGAIGTPEALLYYQNYHMLVEVYVGIEAGHDLAADDPIQFEATIRAIPDSNNVCNVDVSEIVREHLFMLNTPDYNDINLWTSFYIKYAESYDIVTADEIVQFISNYTSDSSSLMYGLQAKMAFQHAYGGNMLPWIQATTHQGLFLTKFERPTLWRNFYFDLSMIFDPPVGAMTFRYEMFDKLGNSLGSNNYPLTSYDEGLYRMRIDDIAFNANTDFIVCYVDTTTLDSPELTIDVKNRLFCDGFPEIYLCWLNNLGGFDYWNFTAYSDYGIEFGDTETYKININDNWDTNFINGETVENYNKIEAFRNVKVRSQLLTRQQVEAIAYVKTSPLVQVIDGTSKITVMVDKGNFAIIEEEKRMYTLVFSLRYTDMIPVQSA